MSESDITSEQRKQFTGAELIVYLLEQHGITTVSGIPGGAALPFYDALGKSKKNPSYSCKT